MSPADTDRPVRVYLDNAATSFPKPPGVVEAMVRFSHELGASAGRGAYDEALRTAGLVADCRRRVARLLNAERAESIVFCLNGTDALNLAIHGLIDPSRPGNHLVCTAMDHNSVLRPMYELAARGWAEVTVVPADPERGAVDPAAVRRAIRPETRLVAITHVSNVSGSVQPIEEVARACRERDVPVLVDAAQSAGHVPIDVQALGLDLLAAPGHKGLLGPAGTGVLYLRPGMERLVRPVRQGGTGSVSEQLNQPTDLPDRYECGSHNAVGLAGLAAGLAWIERRTVVALAGHERALVEAFLGAVEGARGLRVLGGRSVDGRVGVFGVRVDRHEPAEVSAILETEFGVLSRSGLHCAPLAHRTFGTDATGGATRLSFGPFVTREDVILAAEALCRIAGA